jgi:hypothetical protein
MIIHTGVWGGVGGVYGCGVCAISEFAREVKVGDHRL